MTVTDLFGALRLKVSVGHFSTAKKSAPRRSLSGVVVGREFDVDRRIGANRHTFFPSYQTARRTSARRPRTVDTTRCSRQRRRRMAAVDLPRWDRRR
jgi:hypothetical protein